MVILLPKHIAYIAVLHPQHAPLVRVVYTHLLPELAIRHRGKTLCQNVSNLILSGNISQFNQLVLNHLPEEMVTHINMLHMVVELQVSSDGDSRLIVNVEGGGRGVSNPSSKRSCLSQMASLVV